MTTEEESCQLGTGRGDGEQDLLGKSRFVVAVRGEDIEEGEVREVREERGERGGSTVVRGEAEREVGFGRAVEAEPPSGDEGDTGSGRGKSGTRREAAEDFFQELVAEDSVYLLRVSSLCL